MTAEPKKVSARELARYAKELQTMANKSDCNRDRRRELHETAALMQSAATAQHNREELT